MISFHPYLFDADRGLHVIPPEARRNEDFELNVCNSNGIELLLALGLQPEPDGLLEIATFTNLVTCALRRHLGRRSPALEPVEDAAPGRMTVVFGERSEGYVERRLGDLARLLQQSRMIGATHFGWG
ncbi:MAG TPA: hypothetical protein VKG78_06435 [Opitutaceae bacterium]|nr:hypothetical protein [Opitutaceae bacterium]